MWLRLAIVVPTYESIKMKQHLWRQASYFKENLASSYNISRSNTSEHNCDRNACIPITSIEVLHKTYHFMNTTTMTATIRTPTTICAIRINMPPDRGDSGCRSSVTQATCKNVQKTITTVMVEQEKGILMSRKWNNWPYQTLLQNMKLEAMMTWDLYCSSSEDACSNIC